MCVCVCVCVQIIHVNLTTDSPVAVQAGTKLTFTYSVNWQPTRTPFARRFERYLDYSFFEHKVTAHTHTQTHARTEAHTTEAHTRHPL